MFLKYHAIKVMLYSKSEQQNLMTIKLRKVHNYYDNKSKLAFLMKFLRKFLGCFTYTFLFAFDKFFIVFLDCFKGFLCIFKLKKKEYF